MRHHRRRSFDLPYDGEVEVVPTIQNSILRILVIHLFGGSTRNSRDLIPGADSRLLGQAARVGLEMKSDIETTRKAHFHLLLRKMKESRIRLRSRFPTNGGLMMMMNLRTDREIL